MVEGGVRLLVANGLANDERVWLEKLRLHIYNNINPLLKNHFITYEQVLEAIGLPPQHLAQLELVTITHLNSKISSSFTARILDDVHKDFTAKLSGSSKYPLLIEAPVFLLGVLKSSISSSLSDSNIDYTGLILADATGKIPCEVSQSCSALEGMGNVVLPTKWSLIHSISNRGCNYIELQEFVLIEYHSTSLSPPQKVDEDAVFSIGWLFQDFVKQKSQQRKNSVLDVFGKVSAVGEVFRNGRDLLFLLRVVDVCDAESFLTIFILTPSLLHFSSLLNVSHVYLFTAMEVKVVNKGKSSERKVLSSTNATQITPYSPCLDLQPLIQSQCLTEGSCSPTPKRIKLCNQVESSSRASCPLRRCASEELVLYQGVVTNCVYPEVGMYELDGRVLLYLAHYECSSFGRGLRCGVTITISNVCVLNVKDPTFKHISGFFCCSLSSLRIVKFSLDDSPYRPFFTRNKFITLTKKCGVVDTGWLLEVYRTLIDRDIRQNARSCFHCLQELYNMANLTPLKRDVITDFTVSPSTDYLQKGIDLSSRPQAPSMEEFKRTIMERLSSEGFRWWRGEGGGGVASETGYNVSYIIRTEWMFGIVKTSEMEPRQVLIGRLQGCKNSGFLVLQDKMGTLRVVSIIPKICDQILTESSERNHSKLLIVHIGCQVMVTDYMVIVEKIISKGLTGGSEFTLQLYIHPISFTVVPLTTENNTDRTKLPICPFESFLSHNSEELAQTVYFRVLNKNIVITDPVRKCEFTCQALIHANIQVLAEGSNDTGVRPPLKIGIVFGGVSFKWFSLISNNSLYSLSLNPDSSDLELISWKALEKNLSLIITEDMFVEFVGVCDRGGSVLDVAELSKRLLLPPFQTLNHREVVEEKRYPKLESVSLRGRIISHSYRIDHMTLETTAPNSTTATTPRKIIALTLQSLHLPDTINVYCEFRQGIPLPIGLVPGTVATFNSFKLKTSKSGNSYCTSSALSSIDINDMSDVERYTTGHSTIPEMLTLPVTYMNELMLSLVRGSLSKSIVCVRVCCLTVLRFCVSHKCKGCQTVITNERCSASCVRHRPSIEVDARLLMEDGSGCGHIYASGDLVQRCLCVPQAEWKDLCDLVTKIGRVAYVKKTYQQFRPTEDVVVDRSKFSPLDKAKHMMTEFALRPTVQRTFKLICQPFVSREERERTIVGQKVRTFKLRGSEFSTLTLPRLQLRGMCLIELTEGRCVRECERLLGHDRK